MSDIESRYHTNLLEYGFKELSTTNELSGIGRLYSVPKEYGEGTYWIYSEKDLYDIKIHDFCFHKAGQQQIQQQKLPKAITQKTTLFFVKDSSGIALYATCYQYIISFYKMQVTVVVICLFRVQDRRHRQSKSF